MNVSPPNPDHGSAVSNRPKLRLDTIGSLLTIALVVALLAISATIVLADDKTAARTACEGDYRRLCSGVMPGGGRVRACLVDHRQDLSPACRQLVDAKAGQ